MTGQVDTRDLCSLKPLSSLWPCIHAQNHLESYGMGLGDLLAPSCHLGLTYADPSLLISLWM